MNTRHRFVGRSWLVSLSVPLLSCGAPAPGAETLAEQQEAIQGGQLEPVNFPAVGSLFHSQCPGGQCCTGTLIAPYLVLTAKHCTTPVMPTSFVLSNGIIKDFVSTPIVHPTRDMAVLRLKNDQPIRNVVPMVVDTYEKPALGSRCTVVGLGNHTENGQTTNGEKRSAIEEVIYSLGAGPTQFATAGSSGHGFSTGFADAGDSGGPYICNNRISGVVNEHSITFGVTYHAGIDAQWIANVMSDFTSEPMLSAASWGMDRLDIFGRGRDGQVVHKSRDVIGGQVSWGPTATGPWNNMGGLIVGTPEVVSWGTGRLDTYERGTDLQPYTLIWDQGWGWFGLGPTKLSSHISATSWGPGRVDLFALDTVGRLRHKSFDLNHGGWAPPQTAEWDDVLSGVFLDSIKAISWGPNRLDVFGLGLDNHVYHKAWNGSQWLPSTAGYDDLGTAGGGFRGTIAAVRPYGEQGLERVDIFVKAADKAMYHKAWDNVSSHPGHWLPSQTTWDFLGGAFNASPGAFSSGGPGIWVYGQGTDGLLYVKSGFPPTGTNWGQPYPGSISGSPVGYYAGANGFYGALTLGITGLNGVWYGYFYVPAQNMGGEMTW